MILCAVFFMLLAVLVTPIPSTSKATSATTTTSSSATITTTARPTTTTTSSKNFYNNFINELIADHNSSGIYLSLDNKTGIEFYNNLINELLSNSSSDIDLHVSSDDPSVVVSLETNHSHVELQLDIGDPRNEILLDIDGNNRLAFKAGDPNTNLLLGNDAHDIDLWFGRNCNNNNYNSNSNVEYYNNFINELINGNGTDNSLVNLLINKYGVPYTSYIIGGLRNGNDTEYYNKLINALLIENGMNNRNNMTNLPMESRNGSNNTRGVVYNNLISRLSIKQKRHKVV
ncbi:unnamed protein product [Gongylonema pulchrum]|uniref:Uncharacterized protein n=1 Tax=Gongylonema pulchrum TaxID=637853 RepID=A0A183D5U1_9BILA|nr:unnamed protein product [Gongylonema pulchrum]